jgi:DNA-nicking Smr family endonuclease
VKKPSPDKTASDRALWEQVQTTIKPLHNPRLGKVSAAATQKPVKVTEDLHKNYVPRAPHNHRVLTDLTSGSSANIDANTLKRLRSGELEIASKLDLHGHTLARAHAALNRFVHHHYRAGNRCVLVITGRSGQLHAEVPRWLNEPEVRPFIVAFSPAQQKHGGAGALYLLLRRQRQ